MDNTQKFNRSSIKIREFQESDAHEVAALIAKTLRTVNIKDYF